MQQNDCKKSQRVIFRLKYVVFALLGLIIVVQNVFADVEKPQVIKITKNVRVQRAVSEDIVKSKIFFHAEKNDYLTKYINDAAKKHGLNIAESMDEAQTVFTVTGAIVLSGGGIKETSINYDKLDEKLLTSNFEPEEVGSSESIKAQDVALAGAYAGIKSVVGITEALNYITQITGISGAVNKALTGDARGFCYGDLCENIQHSVIMAFRNPHAMWYSRIQVVYPTLYISGAIDEQLNSMFEPLLKKGQE